MDSFVSEALANGASPYKPMSERRFEEKIKGLYFSSFGRKLIKLKQNLCGQNSHDEFLSAFIMASLLWLPCLLSSCDMFIER